MNKVKFIDRISQEIGFSKSETEKVLMSLVRIVVKTLKKGDKVVLSGFGAFLLSRRAKRKGRNPHTGETITIKASEIPRFRSGKDFKQLLQ